MNKIVKKIKEILKIKQENTRGVKIKEISFVNRGDGQPKQKVALCFKNVVLFTSVFSCNGLNEPKNAIMSYIRGLFSSIFNSLEYVTLNLRIDLSANTKRMEEKEQERKTTEGKNTRPLQ